MVTARRFRLFAAFLVAGLAAFGSFAQPVDEALLDSLEWREIGPYRGGRSAAVAGIPQQRDVYYFGATGGGVWKTENGGTDWRNISDGFFGGSIGAVSVSQWDPNVIYVGGGEKTVRGNVSHGDGVWKSVDAGKTWENIGLTDSRHIPRIRIHPKNPDRVYVAALGHLYGPNDERGVYRSDDGGETWQRVLYVSEHAGAVDLVMDPTNPRVLYASFWRVLRTPWSLESGGEGSGLWKTVDGGENWTELTGNEGLPAGTWGISGIAVSASDPENLYAIVEAEQGGVFRSGDGGETWQKTNDERSLRQRAWYYTRIYADPADTESVYVVNVRFHHSKDGGKTFSQIPTPHGDNHDLWIDPGDPRRMIEANDGGANVSYDGGETWSTQANQPTAQMYRVSTDNAFPYRLLGGQQDNSAVRIRSRSARRGAIGTRDWEPTAGGESGHIVAKPDDPDIVYGGSYGGFLTRLDHRTGEVRAVNIWPDNPMGWGAADLKERFQWNFPLFFSPHNPNRLYAASQRLFVTEDEGQSWQPLSGDLTRDDKSKMGPSGGPITKDNTSVEYYGTIFAALESPHQAGVFWTGSDDGLIHLSRDGGETWTDVTPPGLPEWTQINGIDPHPTEPGGLYVAATRYKLDDFRPYLYRTLDWGTTWTKITGGIPEDQFTRALRADPDRPGLLYAGTERGVWVSFDDGGSWQSLQLELPEVPITDLAVKEGDLVAATQGRGYWILDDLHLLQQLEAGAAAPSEAARLYQPAPTHRLAGGRRDELHVAGTNPPDGAVIHFWLTDDPKAVAGSDVEEEEESSGQQGNEDESEEKGKDTQEIRLEILDDGGDLIRTFRPKKSEGQGEDAGSKADVDPAIAEVLELEQGANRFVWDLRYPGAERFPGLVIWNDVLDKGPWVAPGSYRARLTVGEWSDETAFEVLADPRSSATAEDHRLRRDFMLSVRDKLTGAHREVRRLREVRDQLQTLRERDGLDDGVTAAAEELSDTLEEIEKTLYQTENRSRQDPLNFPIRLNDKLAGVLALVSYGDRRPTAAALAVRDELVAAIDEELVELQSIWESDLPAFNALLREKEVAGVFLEL
ncbi:MAG: glycosyl hydrolase [Acidobacteriota bacterium]